jgi:hypothetical protein
MKQKELCDQHA